MWLFYQNKQVSRSCFLSFHIWKKNCKPGVRVYSYFSTKNDNFWLLVPAIPPKQCKIYTGKEYWICRAEVHLEIGQSSCMPLKTVVDFHECSMSKSLRNLWIPNDFWACKILVCFLHMKYIEKMMVITKIVFIYSEILD